MTAGPANPGRGCAGAGRLASQPAEWAPAAPRAEVGLGLRGSSRSGALATFFFTEIGELFFQPSDHLAMGFWL